MTSTGSPWRRRASTTSTSTRQGGRLPVLDRRRHRHRRLLRRRQSDRPGLARRDPGPLPGHGGRGLRRPGKPVRGEKGELVCTKPFPSMPVGFWDDPDGARYRAAYFERFPRRLVPRRLRRADRARRHRSSTAAPTRPSTRAACASARRRSTARSSSWRRSRRAIVIGQDWEGDVRVVLFVRLREGAGRSTRI